MLDELYVNKVASSRQVPLVNFFRTAIFKTYFGATVSYQFLSHTPSQMAPLKSIDRNRRIFLNICLLNSFMTEADII